MTQQQLKDIMLFQLRNFNRTGNDVDGDTVLSTVLSTGDGDGTYSSAVLFKAFVRYSIIHAGAETNENKSWPNNWLSMNINTLAQKLIPEEDVDSQEDTEE